MTRELFDPLDLELRRLLRGLNEGPPAPREARARLRGALQLGGDPFPPDGSGSSAGRPGSFSRPLPQTGVGARLAKTAAQLGTGWTVGGIGAAALIGGWIAFGPQRQATSDGPPQQLPTLEQKVATQGAKGPAVLPSADVAPKTNGLADDRGDDKALAAANAAAPASESSVARPEKRAVDSSLAAERRLLDAARAALVAGDSSTGLERLARHARQFPRGALAEERAALMVDALVAAGRYDEARRRADAFHARYPGSLFAPSVNAALQAIR